jgi:adhesin/invasin
MHSSVVFRRALAVAAAALLPIACSDSSSGPDYGTAAEIEVVAGEDQSGPAGAQLPVPIVVLVLDADGNPVPNQSMTFQVMAGGGTVQDATPRTDDDGFAGARWTLGPTVNVEQRLEARAVSGGNTLVSVSILATAGPGAPAQLVVIPPGTQGSVYPGVRVVDLYGNPSPGVTVTFSVTAGGGTLEGATQMTNALGIATVGRWNLGAPGANTIQASAGTLTPVTYTINQRDFVPARLVLSSGQGQTAVVGTEVAIRPAVIVQNAAGEPLSDVVVSFTPGPNSGGVNFPTATSNANGVATIGSWTIGNLVGPHTLVASVSPAATFTFNATGTPSRVGRLEKNAGDGQIGTVGTAVAIPPSVKVLDIYGNPVPNYPVTFSVYNGGGSITGANAVSNASGIATVGSWTLGTLAVGNTLRASASGAAQDIDFTAMATTGQASRIVPHAINPTSALVRSEITLRVIVLDDIDRPKAGVPVSFAPITSQVYGSGTVLAPSQNVLTDEDGVASVGYVMPDNVYAPGGVMASVTGLPSLQVNVSPMVGPASQIKVTLPSTPVVAGADLGRPTFSVVDADDNPIPFFPVTFTVTAGGGTLDGAAERTVSTAPPPGGTALGPMWKSGATPGVNTIVISAEGVPSVTISRTTTP